MSDWIDFTGRIVAMPWGDSVFTVLPIPDDICAELTAQGARRVEVELNDHPFNMALTKSPALDQVFVYTGKTVLSEAEISAGDEIEVRLRKADPNAVDVPGDVFQAILEHGQIDAWNALTPGKQRGLLHLITRAKRPETRAARILKLVAELDDA